MSLNKFCLFFLCILVSSLSFAQGVNLEDSVNLTEIVKNQNNCIKSVDENKLYLQENNIYPTQEGLFLIVNDNRPLA